MALTVAEFTSRHGTHANSYWKWSTLRIDADAAQAVVSVRGYLSPVAYAAGKEPIGEQVVTVTGDAYLQIGAVLEGAVPQKPLSEVIYGYLRENEGFFAGAAQA